METLFHIDTVIYFVKQIPISADQFVLRLRSKFQLFGNTRIMFMESCNKYLGTLVIILSR